MTDSFDFEANNLWDNYAPQEYRLSKRIRGKHTISFVISNSLIFGGFEFIPVNRAYDKLYAATNDDIYGDEYVVSGLQVTDIGNNVNISFKGLDFGEGTESVVVCGKTPNVLNSIQLRDTGEDGIQHTQLLEFMQSEL